MKRLIAIVLILMAGNLSSETFDPFDHSDAANVAPRHVRVQVKLIETSQTELSRITGNPKPLQESLYTSISTSIKAGKARLIHESVVVARSGQKATVESFCGMIYPTEYDPPGLPLSIEQQKQIDELLANYIYV
ncbi:MAG: hypothetical protein KJO79_02080, partial [Verrucomicrobiae bacterium]|nr:hypothetical protein [Verrucomicrobiae bacterium]NNJ85941.1 hypothetical protein [Akkermansiaceae bacterium]